MVTFEEFSPTHDFLTIGDETSLGSAQFVSALRALHEPRADAQHIRNKKDDGFKSNPVGKPVPLKAPRHGFAVLVEKL